MFFGEKINEKARCIKIMLGKFQKMDVYLTLFLSYIVLFKIFNRACYFLYGRQRSCYATGVAAGNRLLSGDMSARMPLIP